MPILYNKLAAIGENGSITLKHTFAMYRSISVIFLSCLWLSTSYVVWAADSKKALDGSISLHPSQESQLTKKIDNKDQSTEFTKLKDRPLTEYQELFAELKNKPPIDIFNKANRAFHDKEYTTAIKVYRVLNSLYPFSEYAEKSKLYSIQAHYYNEGADEVIRSAGKFIKLYPTSEYLEAISYLKAKAYFYRHASFLVFTKYLPFLKIDFSQRSDSTQLAETAHHFAGFLARFPNGAYREKAQKKLDTLHEMMVKKEYHIAHFYFKRRNYLAAYNRIVVLLDRYPRACDMLSKKYADILSKEYQYAKKQLGLTL